MPSRLILPPQLSREELEQQANLLLYGTRNVIEEAEEREYFTIIGRGAPKRVLVFYSIPKPHLVFGKPSQLETCAGCGRPRSYGSGSMCRACYRGRAQARFRERSQYIEHWMEENPRNYAANIKDTKYEGDY